MDRQSVGGSVGRLVSQYVCLWRSLGWWVSHSIDGTSVVSPWKWVILHNLSLGKDFYLSKRLFFLPQRFWSFVAKYTITVRLNDLLSNCQSEFLIICSQIYDYCKTKLSLAAKSHSPFSSRLRREEKRLRRQNFISRELTIPPATQAKIISYQIVSLSFVSCILLLLRS